MSETQEKIAPPSSDELKALENALAGIEKEFGKGAIMNMSDKAKIGVPTVPTGALALDIALGGGLPIGRIAEIYGPESAGKTTACYHVMAEVQRRGGVCAFVDAEHSMDPLYAGTIGVDIDKLLVSQPDTGEQALQIVERLVRSGAVRLIVVDSVAALTPKAEIEGEIGDSHVGLQARMMSQALRKLASLCNENDTMILFTNQLREKIGVMFGSPETTPGGRALRFYASVRMDIRRIETLKDGTDSIGIRARIKVVKNKVAPPFKQAEFDILYGQGIDREGTLLDIGVEKGIDIISKSGAYQSYGEIRLGQGRNAARQFLKDNPEVAAEIEEKILVAKGVKPGDTIEAEEFDVDALAEGETEDAATE